jgi:hypothetical protein
MVELLVAVIAQLLAWMFIIFLLLSLLGLVFPPARAVRRLYVRLLWRGTIWTFRRLWTPRFTRSGGAHLVPDRSQREEGG